MTDLLVCCGLATLDVVQVVDTVPGPNEKVVAHGLTVTFGGPAANAAATAVALGVRARLVTALGEGPVARLVSDALAGAGVEVVDLLAGTPAVPPVSTVLVTRGTGERAVVSVNATGVPDVTDAASDVVDRALAGAGAVLVDGHVLPAAVVVARAARAAGIPVLLDGGSWKPGLERLLAHTDHAVLSADFAVPASPAGPARAVGMSAGSRAEQGPDEGAGPVVSSGWTVLDVVAAFGPHTVARSDGPGPVLVRRSVDGVAIRDSIPVPVVPVGEVVDTLGAGDVLHGATAARLARGDHVLTALVEGIRVASESVRHAGALGWVDQPT